MGGQILLKKRYLFLIILVCLFAVSTVNAEDNSTNDIICVDEISDNIISSEVNNDNIKLNDFNSSSKNLNNSNEISYSNEDNNVLSYNGNDDVLGTSPPHNAYSVSVSDTRINSGSSGRIIIYVTPCSGYDYRYDFYLRVYDSNGNQKISYNYYSSSYTTQITHSIDANQLNSGTYTIKLVNYADSYVMDTANLYVGSVPYSAYSVDVSDTSINYGSSGSIYMSISPANSSYYYKYDFYLKVYDSEGNEVISQKYYSTSSDYSKNYYISSYELNPGKYTIKIINYYDNVIMDTANLYVVSVPYSAYSVDVSDTSINYGSSGSIYMSISPASSSYYYRFDFYLKVYDLKGNEVISQRYYDTSSAYSETYYISSYELNPGKYTIKIINYYDNHIMDDAKLYIRDSKNLQLYSEDYYVGDSVNIDYDIVSGATGTLSVYIDDSFIKNVSVGNKINLGKMAFGIYKIKVVYKSNNYYNDFEDSTTFEVNRLTPTLMLSVNNVTVNNYDSFETNITVGNKVILQFMFDEDINGQINVKHESDFDNNTKTLKLVNGKTNLSISKILGDYHLFNITYGGNNKYSPFNLECGLIFKRKTSYIDYEIPDNLLWGDSFVINPVLPKDATGKINITVKDDNGYYFNDIMKIKDKYKFNILNGGKNYLQLDYLGDGNYAPYTYIREFNVTKLNTTFSITDNIEAGNPATINVTLNEDATRIVRLRLNSNNYLGSLVNGSVVFNIPNLRYGNYEISIGYDGDSKYNAFNKQEIINVTLKKTVLTLDLKNIVVNNDVTIIPRISEEATGNIIIYVDNYYKSEIGVGYSYVLSKPGVGKHEVKMVYSGDNYFQRCENTTSFWVFAAYPIEAEDTYVIYNTSNYFKARFYDENHNVLSNKYVVFNVGGKDYARLTDDYGWATFDIDLDIGIYTVTSINAIYNENTTNKLVVFSSIQSENLTSPYNCGVDFNATFLDYKAKPLSNSQIIFKINGTDYLVKTDMYGQAVLNEGLSVGTYEVISINTRTMENKTNYLTIIPSIQCEDMIRAYNSSMDYKATFIGANNDYLINTHVTFEIGLNKYNVITDEKGTAILNVPLAVGEYNVTAVNPITHERSTKKLTIVERIVNNTDMVTFTNSKDYFRVVVIGDNAAVCGKNERVVFTLNNIDYSVKTDKYGHASLLIPSLKQGVYKINTSYKGFTASNYITVFKELKSIISIDVVDVNYTENVCFNVSVAPKYMHGNLTICISSNNKVLFEFNTTANKLFSKTLKGLNASGYLITVNFTDMDYYYASQDFTIFKVLKINPKIIVVANDVKFNQDAIISINIPNVSGNVTIRVGNKLNFTEYIPRDGVIVKNISKLNSGKYPINVIFEGNDNYNSFTSTSVLNVKKLSTTLKLSYVNNTYNGITLTAIVNPSSAGGNVLFVVNDKNYTVKISKYKATLKLSDLDAGSYTVKAVYMGDVNHYQSTSNSIKFTVPKTHVNISASDVSKAYGGSKKLEITLTNINSKAVTGAKIRVSLAGKNHTLTTNANGKASLDLNLDSGSYIADIVFAGNKNYFSESTSVKVTINKVSSNIAISYTKNSYNSVTLTADVSPSTAGGNVVFNINGKEYVAKISNGKATYILSNLAFDSYNVKAVYNGDINHKASTSNSISFTVDEHYVVITSPDVTKNYGGSEKLEIILTNQDSKYVSNAEIRVSLAGKNHTLTTDANGKASLKLDLNSGTYTAYILFVGNSEYFPESTSVKVTINQLTTNLALSYINDTYNNVTLTAIVNPSSAGGNVVFTVNNKDYTVKVSGGRAILKLYDLNEGSYTVNAVYNGDVNHKKSTSNSIKFTIPKHYVNISAPDVSKVYGGIEKLEIALFNQDLNGVSNAEIRVSLDGTVYTLTTDGNGKISLDLDLNSGTYTAYILFVGNRDYKSENTIAKVTINQLTTDIVSYYTKNSYNNITLTAIVNPLSAGGKMLFTTNNKNYTVNIMGGKATLNLADLAIGSYTVNAVYNGDVNHKKSTSNSIKFNVSEHYVNIAAPDVSKVYGGSEKLEITLTNQNSKAVSNVALKIRIGDKIFTKTTDGNGKVYVDLNMDSGNYIAEIVFEGNDEYDKSVSASQILINKINTEITLSATKNSQNIYTLTAIVNPTSLTGDVIFTVNGKDYTAKIDDYGAKYVISNLKIGSYDAKASYMGDINYKSSISNTVRFTVEETKYNLFAPDVTKYYGGPERFTVSLKDKSNKPIANANVKIYINGRSYDRTTDENGIASMGINLNSGKYDVTTEYGGEKVYSTVIIKDTVIAKDFTKIFRNGTQYYGTFVDSKGNLIKNTDVKININGVFYTRKTDGNGVAKMNINLPPGTYILTATNPSSGEQHTTKITVLPSIVENHDLTKYYKNASKYTLKIIGDDGKPVGEGVTVKLNINGVFYERKTNTTGYINMNINLPPGTYTVTAEYNGLKASNKITIWSVLKTRDLSMKYKDGSKFEAKILDGQGRPYAGQTVKFNINGVFYTKTTEADGIARLNINLLPGEYIITSSYNGLNAANKVTISG